MQKTIICYLLMLIGISCLNCVSADENNLSNTAFLTANKVNKLIIGRSFSNCKSTRLERMAAGLKTCDSANLSDFYYMATNYFHQTAIQLFSKKTCRMIDSAGIKLSLGYREKTTSFALNAHF